MEIGEGVATPSEDSSDDEDSSDELGSVVVQLIDQDGQPVSGAPYELALGGDVRAGTTGGDGTARADEVRVPSRCRFSWGHPPDPDALPDDPPDLPFETVLYLDYAESDQDPDEGAQERLHNLGYPGDDFAEDIAAFQADFDVPAADWFDQATWDKLRSIHDEIT
jgi:hypothetical protein